MRFGRPFPAKKKVAELIPAQLSLWDYQAPAVPSVRSDEPTKFVEATCPAAPPIERSSDAELSPHPLLSPHSEEAQKHIAEMLSEGLGCDVKLSFTNNRRSMMTSKREGDGYRVRLHRIFEEAEPTVLHALTRYIRVGDRKASRILSNFVHRERHRTEALDAENGISAPRTKPPKDLFAQGEHHHLTPIFEDLEREYFPGQMEGVSITWGERARATRKRRRSIRLGSYSHDDRVIRMHPALDQTWVPHFFVKYILFHEMLHHVEKAISTPERTIFHTEAFRKRERAYPDFERALAWEKLHIHKLLRS